MLDIAPYKDIGGKEMFSAIKPVYTKFFQFLASKEYLEKKHAYYLIELVKDYFPTMKELIVAYPESREWGMF
jgi:hypothetical protein